MVTGRTANEYGNKVHFGLLPPYFDKIDFGYPDTVTEVYTYSRRAPDDSLEIQAIIEVIFTDDTKCFISSIERTFVADSAY